MFALMQSIPAKSFDASAATASTGTAYALLPQAQQVQWTTSFGTDPDAVSIAIQTSLDNSVWTTIVTTTTVGGASNYFQTSAVFIRAKINSITNGAEVTVNLVAKVGIVGLVTPSSVTDGSLVTYSGTTGSKFGELAFDGDPDHVLLGDGSFGAVPGGGNPFDQDLNTTDNVKFSGVGIRTPGMSNAITLLSAANVSFLDEAGVFTASYLSGTDSGGNQTLTLAISATGDGIAFTTQTDTPAVLTGTGGVSIVGGINTWSFNTDGSLIVPGSITATTGNYSALPASSMGLSAGDLYQTAGAVMIVL